MKRYWIVRVLIRLVTPESITIAYCLAHLGAVVYCVVLCGLTVAPKPSDSGAYSDGSGIQLTLADTNDYELQPLRNSGTPLQTDLANRVFNKGDPVETLIEKYKPDQTIDQPPFQTFFYPGITRIIAKDGKLIQAETQLNTDPQVFMKTLSAWKVRFFGQGWIRPSGYVDTHSVAAEAYFVEFRSASMAVVGAALLERGSRMGAPCD